MRAWIFQANPDGFDLEGYLASRPSRITWTVRQHASLVAPGDLVYIWLARGKRKARSGIVATATVLTTPALMPDDEGSRSFWSDPTEALRQEQRVWLRLERVAKKEDVVRREWLSEDPVCSRMSILRQPVGTNFPVSAEEADRLSKLWARAGVAPGSLDDASELEDQVRRRMGESLETLAARVEGLSARTVLTRQVVASVFSRNPDVIAYARLRAGNRCEVVDCPHPLFVRENGEPYVEVHHLKTLADGGPDVAENVVCLCPSHHREIHLGENSARLTETLVAIRGSEHGRRKSTSSRAR